MYHHTRNHTLVKPEDIVYSTTDLSKEKSDVSILDEMDLL